MLRIFTPVKIQRLLPGLNPRTWLPEASMLTTRPPKPSTPQQTPSRILQPPHGFLKAQSVDTTNKKVSLALTH